MRPESLKEPRRAIPIAVLWLLLGVQCSIASAAGGSAARPTTDPLAALPPDSARLKAVRLKLIVGGEDGTDLDGMGPSVSPDGRYVAFRGWSDVFLHDLRTGKTTTLCHFGNPQEFAWNADGTWISFAGELNEQHNYMPSCIWLVRPDGSGLRRVRGSGPDDRRPIWSPDGRSLVWTRGRRLWQSDTTGRGGRFLTRLSSDRYHLEYARGWSTDRTHLRYLSGSEMNGDEWRLRVVGRDSTDDISDASRVPAVTVSEVGALADGSLLYRGVENAIEFIEPGAGGRVRRCFVQPDLHVWNVSIAEDRSVAVFEVGDEEEAHLWAVELRARSRRKP